LRREKLLHALIEIVNFVSVTGFCTYVMEENYLKISLFEPMNWLSKLMVLSIDAALCTGPEKIKTYRKNEQFISQVYQCDEIEMPLLLIHQQKYKNYAALFSAVVGSALVTVVVILTISEFKATRINMG
jgi:hypothetical protein